MYTCLSHPLSDKSRNSYAQNSLSGHYGCTYSNLKKCALLSNLLFPLFRATLLIIDMVHDVFCLQASGPFIVGALSALISTH